MALSNYTKRPVRFLELLHYHEWKIKVYSISCFREFINPEFLICAKENLSNWLCNSTNYNLENYKIATLILHEGKEGCYAIINWWTDENMLHQHVYFSNYLLPYKFKIYSDKGIFACTWELAVIWFERNAWVENILKNHLQPDFEKYLKQQMNDDV